MSNAVVFTCIAHLYCLPHNTTSRDLWHAEFMANSEIEEEKPQLGVLVVSNIYLVLALAFLA